MDKTIKQNLIQSYLDIIAKRRISVLSYILNSDSHLDPLIKEEGYIKPIYKNISHEILDKYFHCHSDSYIEDPDYFIEKEYYQDTLLATAFQSF